MINSWLWIFISIDKILFKIMNNESLDSEPERDARHRGGGDPDPDILSELEQGGLRFGICGGSRTSGSGFSMANGASAQVSVQSKGTY